MRRDSSPEYRAAIVDGNVSEIAHDGFEDPIKTWFKMVEALEKGLVEGFRLDVPESFSDYDSDSMDSGEGTRASVGYASWVVNTDPIQLTAYTIAEISEFLVDSLKMVPGLFSTSTQRIGRTDVSLDGHGNGLIAITVYAMLDSKWGYGAVGRVPQRQAFFL